MRRDIEHRYHRIKTNLRELVDTNLTGSTLTGNSQQSAIICNNDEGKVLYYVNAGEFVYDIDANSLAMVLERMQQILDEQLLEGGQSSIWAGEYVKNEYVRGTQFAHASLASQSTLYAQATTLSTLLFSEPYIRRIGIAYTATYSDWVGLSDAARTDLANVFSDAIARGVNPRETARVISKRLDVSMSKAFNIAQTEQVGALRQAIWAETVDVQTRLGIKTKLLHLSALKPTSRAWHVSRHGKTYTVEEVQEWYGRDGNRYHCYCNQTPALVDDNGNVLSPALVDRLIKERKAWQEQELLAA